MHYIHWLDLVVLVWFFCCWIGYSHFSKHRSRRHKRLQDAFRLNIQQWAGVIKAREMRIVDTSIIANLERTASFLASSSLLIIAGLLTVVGAMDNAISFVQFLPFAREIPRQMWEIKILLLIFIFIYAFFTYTWCMRQYGLASILIGAAPPVSAGLANAPETLAHEERFARVVGLAVYSFNLGLRAYYFSVAVLAWFIHPLAFMAATAWVVGVLYRREFRSKTLAALFDGQGTA